MGGDRGRRGPARPKVLRAHRAIVAARCAPLHAALCSLDGAAAGTVVELSSLTLTRLGGKPGRPDGDGATAAMVASADAMTAAAAAAGRLEGASGGVLRVDVRGAHWLVIEALLKYLYVRGGR